MTKKINNQQGGNLLEKIQKNYDVIEFNMGEAGKEVDIPFGRDTDEIPLRGHFGRASASSNKGFCSRIVATTSSFSSCI